MGGHHRATAELQGSSATGTLASLGSTNQRRGAGCWDCARCCLGCCILADFFRSASFERLTGTAGLTSPGPAGRAAGGLRAGSARTDRCCLQIYWSSRPERADGTLPKPPVSCYYVARGCVLHSVGSICQTWTAPSTQVHCWGVPLRDRGHDPITFAISGLRTPTAAEETFAGHGSRRHRRSRRRRRTPNHSRSPAGLRTLRNGSSTLAFGR